MFLLFLHIQYVILWLSLIQESRMDQMIFILKSCRYTEASCPNTNMYTNSNPNTHRKSAPICSKTFLKKSKFWILGEHSCFIDSRHTAYARKVPDLFHSSKEQNSKCTSQSIKVQVSWKVLGSSDLNPIENLRWDLKTLEACTQKNISELSAIAHQERAKLLH